MRLVAISPPLRPGQSVVCCKCDKMTTDAVADLDGRPFQDFYCPLCKKDVELDQNALGVRCTLCNAVPRAACRDERGNSNPVPHMARRDAYIRLITREAQ